MADTSPGWTLPPPGTAGTSPRGLRGPIGLGVPQQERGIQIQRFENRHAGGRSTLRKWRMSRSRWDTRHQRLEAPLVEKIGFEQRLEFPILARQHLSQSRVQEPLILHGGVHPHGVGSGKGDERVFQERASIAGAVGREPMQVQNPEIDIVLRDFRGTSGPSGRSGFER